MRSWLLCMAAAMLGCTRTSPNYHPVIPVTAAVQTEPVGSIDDAADDSAIWVNRQNPAASRVLGTDKQAGLYVYDLSGSVVQFLPVGRLNNVDLRQNVTIGSWQGDLAAASNRSDNSVALFSVTAAETRLLWSLPAQQAEPYGLCLGQLDDATVVFIAHKNGQVIAHRLGANRAAPVIGNWRLSSQVEGCVHDDANGRLYVGEENVGLWSSQTRLRNQQLVFGPPTLIDRVGSSTGLTADVEGVAIYSTDDASGYLLASSQGNNSYTVYTRTPPHTFVGRFVIASGDSTDGTEETDGIAVNSANLGSAFPTGLFVAQDGVRPAGEQQNFKLIDWRQISRQLDLE